MTAQDRYPHEHWASTTTGIDQRTDLPPAAQEAGQPTFPVPRSDPFAPPLAYQAGPLRRIALSYGGEAWLVTGFTAARTVLADSAGFSSDPTRQGYPTFPLTSKRSIPGHFLSMDPPQHTRLRQLVVPDFSAAHVKKLQPRMAAAAAHLVDALVDTGSPADLVATVAVPLPALSASELLGTPLADREFFLSSARNLQVHDATVAQRVVAAGRLKQYLEGLVATKRNSTDDDLLGRLARTLDEDGAFSAEELVGVATLVIVAGLETTAGLVALTMLSLLRDPRQGDIVRSDPDRWAGPAVSEALRYWTLAQHGVARVATRDVEVEGQMIRQGDAVVVHLATANRDPEIYADPNSFDATRDTRSQLAFGHGVHRCLGSFVAQSQAQLAVAELVRRLPRLRLAEPEREPSFLAHMLIYGLRDLPVAW
jgi:cytochrome P450